MSCCSNGQMHLCNVWWMLKATYGGLFIVAGADKFFNMLADWPSFISSVVQTRIPLEPAMLIQAIGAWEIVLGLMILTCFTKLGARLAALWLLIIAANLCSMGFPYDRAIRDVVMAVGALSLAGLSCCKKNDASCSSK